MAKVLIVDDDEDIIDNLTMILEQAGYAVSVRRDTEQITAEVAALAPDLIILDVMFPQDPAAGFKAVRELKADPRLAAIPIVVLSAVSQRTAPSVGLSGGGAGDAAALAQAFIEKPIEPRMLLEQVRGLLQPKT